MKRNGGLWTATLLIYAMISGLDCKFAENCMAQKDCGGNLICGANHTCHCSENQLFDSGSGKCLLLLGQPCKNSTDCLPLSTCSPQWNFVTGKFESKCRCVGKYYFTNPASETCEVSAKYGQHCNNTTRQCQDGSLLTCSLEKRMCICEDQETQVYDATTQKCGIRVGELCYFHRNQPDACVSYAHCEFYFAMKRLALCKCNFGYSKGDRNGETCFASHMQICNETSICHKAAGLTCTDGQCLCESPLEQVFDNNSSKCVSIVRADCKMKSCVDHAYCDPNSICQCSPNFSATNDRKSCKLNFGETCDSKKTDTCNHDRGLVCRNGKCVCYDASLAYNWKENICTNQEGKVCGKLQQSRIQRRGKSEIEIAGDQIIIGCEEGMICAKIQGRDTCNCFEVQSVESDRTFRIDLCL